MSGPSLPMTMTRRRYLIVKALEAGAEPFLAIEAVASTAIEHPEWNMSEARTFDEWENLRAAGRKP